MSKYLIIFLVFSFSALAGKFPVYAPEDGEVAYFDRGHMYIYPSKETGEEYLACVRSKCNALDENFNCYPCFTLMRFYPESNESIRYNYYLSEIIPEFEINEYESGDSFPKVKRGELIGYTQSRKYLKGKQQRRKEPIDTAELIEVMQVWEKR